jgi:spermidine/putrescine-binding protein
MWAIFLPTMGTLLAACLFGSSAIAAIESNQAAAAIIALVVSAGIAALAAIGARVDAVCWGKYATDDERAQLRQRNALILQKELTRWLK